MSHKDFVGCMRDLHIDGRQVDMAAFVANNGTVAGRRPCPRGGWGRMSDSPAHGLLWCQHGSGSFYNGPARASARARLRPSRSTLRGPGAEIVATRGPCGPPGPARAVPPVSYAPRAFLSQAARPGSTFATQTRARTTAAAQSAGVASAATVLWALAAETVGSVSGRLGPGGLQSRLCS